MSNPLVGEQVDKVLELGEEGRSVIRYHSSAGQEDLHRNQVHYPACRGVLVLYRG